MTLFSTLFPLICWFAYNRLVPLVEQRYPSLSVIMTMQRRRWVYNISRRESPLDAILSANLMGSVSFFASTSALLVLAVFATFGQLPSLMQAVSNIALDRAHSEAEVQLHLIVMLAIFVLSFFSFTLALRQFNHFCIMVGAIDHSQPTSEAEIDAIARINALGAQNFNTGIRAYYFSVATVAWFAAEWMAIVVSLLTVGFLVHREFFSTAHRTAAMTLIAHRRDQEKTAAPRKADL